jgi:hypothetical protein
MLPALCPNSALHICAQGKPTFALRVNTHTHYGWGLSRHNHLDDNKQLQSNYKQTNLNQHRKYSLHLTHVKHNATPNTLRSSKSTIAPRCCSFFAPKVTYILQTSQAQLQVATHPFLSGRYIINGTFIHTHTQTHTHTHTYIHAQAQTQHVPQWPASAHFLLLCFLLHQRLTSLLAHPCWTLPAGSPTCVCVCVCVVCGFNRYGSFSRLAHASISFPVPNILRKRFLNHPGISLFTDRQAGNETLRVPSLGKSSSLNWESNVPTYWL